MSYKKVASEFLIEQINRSETLVDKKYTNDMGYLEMKNRLDILSVFKQFTNLVGEINVLSRLQIDIKIVMVYLLLITESNILSWFSIFQLLNLREMFGVWFFQFFQSKNCFQLVVCLFAFSRNARSAIVTVWADALWRKVDKNLRFATSLGAVILIK